MAASTRGVNSRACAASHRRSWCDRRESTRAALDGQPYEQKVLPHPSAFNVFSHNMKVDPVTGYDEEEYPRSMGHMRDSSAFQCQPELPAAFATFLCKPCPVSQLLAAIGR